MNLNESVGLVNERPISDEEGTAREIAELPRNSNDLNVEVSEGTDGGKNDQVVVDGLVGHHKVDK